MNTGESFVRKLPASRWPPVGALTAATEVSVLFRRLRRDVIAPSDAVRTRGPPLPVSVPVPHGTALSPMTVQVAGLTSIVCTVIGCVVGFVVN